MDASQVGTVAAAGVLALSSFVCMAKVRGDVPSAKASKSLAPWAGLYAALLWMVSGRMIETFGEEGGISLSAVVAYLLTAVFHIASRHVPE